MQPSLLSSMNHQLVSPKKTVFREAAFLTPHKNITYNSRLARACKSVARPISTAYRSGPSTARTCRSTNRARPRQCPTTIHPLCYPDSLLDRQASVTVFPRYYGPGRRWFLGSIFRERGIKMRGTTRQPNTILGSFYTGLGVGG